MCIRDRAYTSLGVNSFAFEYMSTPLDAGAQINFADYLFLKQYKFTDFIKGVIDTFNLSINADPINKVITIEPTHPYSLDHNETNKSGGYIDGNFLDWTNKQDLNKVSQLNLYSDTNREFIFRFRDDSADGCLRVVTDRIQNFYQYKQDAITTSLNTWAVTKSILGAAKYILCLLYTSPSPRDRTRSRMPSSA